jgi:hypothetical protein
MDLHSVYSHWVRQAVVWTVFLAWLFLVIGGLILINSPDRQYPALIGWVFLAVSAIVLYATVKYWLVALPALFGYGAFNGLLALWSGHLGADAGSAISRGRAGVIPHLS